MPLSDDLDLEDAILDLFGEIFHQRLQAAGIAEDLYPTSLQLLTKARECLDVSKFEHFVGRYISAMAPESAPTGSVLGLVTSKHEPDEPDEPCEP